MREGRRGGIGPIDRQINAIYSVGHGTDWLAAMTHETNDTHTSPDQTVAQKNCGQNASTSTRMVAADGLVQCRAISLADSPRSVSGDKIFFSVSDSLHTIRT